MGDGRVRWRTVAAALLIALGCLALIPAVTAVWLQSQVVDSDRYVATVAPLSDDPAVQNAVTTTVTDAIVSRIDVGSPGGPVADRLRGRLETAVGTIVASDQFTTIWTEVNRTAHRQFVNLMTGETTDRGLVVDGDTLALDLSGMATIVQQRLADAGLDISVDLPPGTLVFPLADSSGVTEATYWFGVIDDLGTWLPVTAVVLLAVGVLLAHSRRRALIGAGLGVAAAMLVLGIGLAVGRSEYLSSLPPDLDRDAAGAVFDQVVTFLHGGLRIVLAAGLVVAVVAWIAGLVSAGSRRPSSR